MFITFKRDCFVAQIKRVTLFYRTRISAWLINSQLAQWTFASSDRQLVAPAAKGVVLSVHCYFEVILLHWHCRLYCGLYIGTSDEQSCETMTEVSYFKSLIRYRTIPSSLSITFFFFLELAPYEGAVDRSPSLYPIPSGMIFQELWTSKSFSGVPHFIVWNTTN